MPTSAIDTKHKKRKRQKKVKHTSQLEPRKVFVGDAEKMNRKQLRKKRQAEQKELARGAAVKLASASVIMKTEDGTEPEGGKSVSASSSDGNPEIMSSKQAPIVKATSIQLEPDDMPVSSSVNGDEDDSSSEPKTTLDTSIPPSAKTSSHGPLVTYESSGEDREPLVSYESSSEVPSDSENKTAPAGSDPRTGLAVGSDPVLEKILDLQELSDSAPKTPHVSNPADASGSAKPAAASEPAPNERLEPLLVVLDLQGTLVFFDSTINADRPRPYLAPFLSFLASNDALCRQRLDIAICAVFYQPCGSKVLTYIGLLSNDSETILRDKKWTAKPGEPLARIVSLDEMNAREGDDVELGRCIKLVLEGTGWTPERTVFVSSQEFDTQHPNHLPISKFHSSTPADNTALLALVYVLSLLGAAPDVPEYLDDAFETLLELGQEELATRGKAVLENAGIPVVAEPFDEGWFEKLEGWKGIE